MISHQVAHQVVTSDTAHETRILAEVAEIAEETPLTHQLFLPVVGEVISLGDPL